MRFSFFHNPNTIALYNKAINQRANIQGDKIIGAVTHVVVNDPQKGYGIFITTMLEKGENMYYYPQQQQQQRPQQQQQTMV